MRKLEAQLAGRVDRRRREAVDLHGGELALQILCTKHGDCLPIAVPAPRHNDVKCTASNGRRSFHLHGDGLSTVNT